MKSREDIIQLLSDILPELERQYKVSRLGIFGSYARSEQNIDSDVDLLVEVDPSIGLDFVTLAEELESILGAKVDLVSINAIKSKMLDYVKKDLIYV